MRRHLPGPAETDSRLPLFAISMSTGIVLIGGSFLLAALTANDPTLFAMAPTVAPGTLVSAPDIIEPSKLYGFHATIYTVWAAMLLSLPAFCTVWFVRSSRRAHAWWLPFWSVALVAMLVHLYLAMGVLFEWNWSHILSDTVRVTIPVPDLVLTAWWAIDVLLGWTLRSTRSLLVHAQRVLLHAALLVIFLIGFIREGEIGVSRAIGIGVALAVVLSIIVGLRRRAYRSSRQ